MTPGKGYRLLDGDDVIQEDDEFSSFSDWISINDYPKFFGQSIYYDWEKIKYKYGIDYAYSRKIGSTNLSNKNCSCSIDELMISGCKCGGL